MIDKKSVPIDLGQLGKAVERMADYLGSGINKLRNYIRRQFVRTGTWRNPRNAVVIVFSFFGLYILFSFLSMIVLYPFSLISNVQTDSGISIAFLMAVGIIGYAGVKARSDIKKRQHTYELYRRGRISDVSEAYEYIDHYDLETQNNAILAIDAACDQNVGKVIKKLSDTPEEIVSRLIPKLDTNHEHLPANTASVIAWISTEYPQAVLPHVDTIKRKLRDNRSQLRSELITTLMTLGNADRNRIEEFAEAIVQVIDDDDPEVRHLIAFALGNLPCNQSIDALKHLSQDNNANVRREAQEALQKHLGQNEAGPQPQEAKNTNTESSNADSVETEFIQEAPDETFEDIAGMEDLKQRLYDNVIEPFEGDSVYEKFGVGADSGILLHGPPGTGKTHMARCLAGELGASFADIDVGDMESKWLGEGVENITQLFNEARANQPCLIFIDEIDALATDRSSGNQHDDKKKMVNQLLQELSKIDIDDDIVVIAATNRPDAIDEAMLRSGRFDSKIEIPNPNNEARWKIFNKKLTAPSEEIDRDQFVHATQGFTAADIVEVVNRAARTAAKREFDTGENTRVNEKDIFDSIDEIASERGSVGEFVRNPPGLNFEDVVGMETLKEDLKNKVIDPIENPDRYEEFGLGVEHGFLLYGPPGTGKTYISKALAGEMGITYIEAKAADLVSKWIGEGAQNVQKMFEEARQNAPCLIFIDEIDALASDRSAGNQTKSQRQLVNQFLEEISTIGDEGHDVVVIAATNRPEDIDDAMLRSGRLGEKIEVPPPKRETRVKLYEAHLNAPQGDIDTEWLGEITEGFVASDMQQLANESARIAMQRYRDEGGPKEVGQSEIEEAVTRMLN